MEKKYTDEDLIEIEKIHRDNYMQIHNLASNILSTTKENYTIQMVLDILNISYDKAIYSQKDINISEDDIKKSESDTCNNNSL